MISSTRNEATSVPYSHALTTAQPADGWLWMRYTIPQLSPERIEEHTQLLAHAQSGGDDAVRSAVKSVYVALWKHLAVDLADDDIAYVADALDSFHSPWITPIETLDWPLNTHLLNLSTWPTYAFKDVALQMVTRMVSRILSNHNEKVSNGSLKENLRYMIVLTSTSGDTWPAWWAWIHNQPYIYNFIGYPRHEASSIQAGQMHLLDGNVYTVPMEEWFTAIQDQMKSWTNESYKQELHRIINEKFWLDKHEIDVLAGSFNSINIGRIDAQSLYYVVSYLIGCAQWTIEDKCHLSIPSGNFGHTYGALQANQMLGWVFERIIVSTNENKAIHNLINYGSYLKATEDVRCPSVSMIIKYGSNVERLFAHLYGPAWTAQKMEVFNRWAAIELTTDEQKLIEKAWLTTTCINAEDELATINYVYHRYERLICPHTANAFLASLDPHYRSHHNPGYNIPVLVAETASPWKFPASIYAALSHNGHYSNRPTDQEKKAMWKDYLAIDTTNHTNTQELLTKIAAITGSDIIDAMPQPLHDLYTAWFDVGEVAHAVQFHERVLEIIAEI